MAADPDNKNMDHSVSLNIERADSHDPSLGGRNVLFFHEMKRLGYIAGPMVAVTLSQYMLQIVAIMMVGHLGKLALSGTAIAISLASVTGYSVILGMSSALETLCGQAYGAKQYQKLGTHTFTAIFCLILVCIPLSFLWLYMGKLLVLAGQDPLISFEAGKFMRWLIPTLFAFAIVQSLVRYFQTQSLITPLIISSCACLLVHIPLCWVLVFKLGLHSVGAAMSMFITNWLNVIFLGLYMAYSPSCAKTRVAITTELFQGVREFFRFAIPSAFMVCLEWWSYELLVFLSGILPNPQLEASVISICLNTVATLFTILYGLGAAASTRVSNELGAGNPRAARVAVNTAMFLAVSEAIIVSGTLLACRHVFGYVFSNEKDVVDKVTTMAPLVCISVIIDSIRSVLAGIARGCGLQHIGAYINLGAYYLCGIPVAVVLAFVVHLRAKGLWTGMVSGGITQNVILAIVVICYVNWEKQAIKARERIFKGSTSKDQNGVSS